MDTLERSCAALGSGQGWKVAWRFQAFRTSKKDSGPGTPWKPAHTLYALKREAEAGKPGKPQEPKHHSSRSPRNGLKTRGRVCRLAPVVFF